MNKSAWITLSIIAVAIVSGWFIFMTPRAVAPTSSAPQGTTTTLDVNTKAPESPIVSSANTNVEYSAAGFSPKELTIKQGETVSFTSTDGSPMWVAVDAHPTHTEYAGTTRSEHCPDTLGVAFDQCSRGSTYSFIFTKVGTWKYHNHVSPNMIGTVVVVQ